MEPVVTAGLDSSAESLSAAHWAAQEAQLRKSTLRLLHAWKLLSLTEAGLPAENDQNYWSKRIVDDAQQVIHEHYPDLPVSEELVAEEPEFALLAAAEESEILVLGSRGMEPIANFFLGDIGLHVVARADTPVVLVRAREGTTPVQDEGDVVVALSLHGPCDSLLEFAFDSAARRGVTLHAVHGRGLPDRAHIPRHADTDASEKGVDHAQKELIDALRPWREKFPGVPVIESARHESPARAVVREAAGAGLLVTGRRRRRHVLAPHLGPVVQALVHHAPCPVAVVPYG